MFQCKKAAPASFDVAQCDRSYRLALRYKKRDGRCNSSAIFDPAR